MGPEFQMGSANVYAALKLYQHLKSRYCVIKVFAKSETQYQFRFGVPIVINSTLSSTLTQNLDNQTVTTHEDFVSS